MYLLLWYLHGMLRALLVYKRTVHHAHLITSKLWIPVSSLNCNCLTLR
ncbi:hypothetical protein BofuT4_uP151500.1 [Botrytis cinerea T4]|uniref:Uncharacterized protein n=1 Tax=Botryotinia fuckeliana (strain T4) TaxID=999810 RepID=G2YWM0_BOTF4|nr:hypothetical protein BofuT4_uP151500.1 [Botrytis cinerea T4]